VVFDFPRSIPLDAIAAKSLAVNVSDIAAMGARARAFVLSVGLPEDLVHSFREFARGLAEAAARWNVSLVGGDLSGARDLTVSITAFGDLASRARPLLRSGARAGEFLYLSRPVGGPAAGLHLLRRGWSFGAGGRAVPPADLPAVPGYAQIEFAQSAMRRQAMPEPEWELGAELVEAGVGACIDVSDGLSTDLHRLCRASTCGAIVEWSRIPRFPDIESLGFSLGVDAERAVLHGGEELALLFTSRRTEADLSAALRRPVYRIGKMTERARVTLERDGAERDLHPEGWDHFDRGSRTAD
jgi:thiamine-monophosphate kinase